MISNRKTNSFTASSRVVMSPYRCPWVCVPRTCAAAFIVARSESDPMMIPTRGGPPPDTRPSPAAAAAVVVF